MSAFDYDTQTPDEAIRAVVAEIKGKPLAPLSEAELAERQAWRDELHDRELQRKAEQEYRQLVAEEAARQQEADEVRERNRQARERMHQEYLARSERQSHSHTLRALELESRQSALWRQKVQNSVAYRNHQTLLSELESAMNTMPQPSDDFATRYRNNQRSGLHYVEPEDE